MSGPSRKDFIASGVILILLFTMIKFGMFEFEPAAGGKDYFLPEYFYLETNGIATAKYIDSKNHLYETIEFHFNDSIECYYTFHNKDLDLFYYITVGDSVFKKKRAKQITIRKGAKDSIFRLNQFD